MKRTYVFETDALAVVPYSRSAAACVRNLLRDGDRRSSAASFIFTEGEPAVYESGFRTEALLRRKGTDCYFRI